MNLNAKIILSIIAVGLFNLHLEAQINIHENKISGRINAPILIDQIFEENNLVDSKRNLKKINENVKQDLYINFKSVPLKFFPSGKTFAGKYNENVYGLITTIFVNGYIEKTDNYGSVKVTYSQTKNGKSGVCDYSLTNSYDILYSNLTVKQLSSVGAIEKNKNIIQFYFKPHKNTTLKVTNYTYNETTKCPKRILTKNFVFKDINTEYLAEKISSNWSYFTFNVQWNGKTMEDLEMENVTITEVRGFDENWEPPSAPFLNKNVKTEPKSIGIYYQVIGDENSDALSKGMVGILTADLAKISGLKILERAHINKILQEIELSESGLVKTESKVENKLLKEAMAIEATFNLNTLKANAKVSSKNKEIEIDLTATEESEVFTIQKTLAKVIIKEINEQFNLNVNPEIIYKSGI